MANKTRYVYLHYSIYSFHPIETLEITHNLINKHQFLWYSFTITLSLELELSSNVCKYIIKILDITFTNNL